MIQLPNYRPDLPENHMSHRFDPVNANILVADDEESFRTLLTITLERAGYRVTAVRNGEEALATFQEGKFDLVILDIVMPRLDGIKTCAELRKISTVPVILLTALNRSQDVMAGFRVGADDYITKPFAFREVEMRIHAVLRRSQWTVAAPVFPIIVQRGVELDDEANQVRVHGAPIHLTPTEYQLLRELMIHMDQPISKDELYARVWGAHTGTTTNVVEVAVRRLREKLEPDPSDPTYLVTVRGAGYKFSTEQPRER
ncbi:MAG: response regulator transcription factor [Caldilineaceae bacterium]|nr:response regulator transcription factor [Caldilineaceae bacterium]